MISPRVAGAGLALLDGQTARPLITHVFQYAPAPLRRSLVVGPGASGETLEFDLELDAADELEVREPPAAQGLRPQLATLEAIAQPPPGAREPVIVLVLGEYVLPVRILELTVAEDAFDMSLQPVRAVASIRLAVLREGEGGPLARHLVARLRNVRGALLEQATEPELPALENIVPPSFVG